MAPTGLIGDNSIFDVIFFDRLFSFRYAIGPSHFDMNSERAKWMPPTVPFSRVAACPIFFA